MGVTYLTEGIAVQKHNPVHPFPDMENMPLGTNIFMFEF